MSQKVGHLADFGGFSRQMSHFRGHLAGQLLPGISMSECVKEPDDFRILHTKNTPDLSDIRTKSPANLLQQH